MPISHACVAAESRILCQHDNKPPNGTPAVVQKILQNLKRHDQKSAYAYEHSVFNYLVANQIVYLCVTDKADARRFAFGYLEDLKGKFCEKYAAPGSKYPQAHELGQCGEFKREMEKLMTFHNSDPESDKIRHLQAQVTDVTNIMVENIETLLKQGERLEDLKDKTDQLSDSAASFKHSSRKLKRTMQMRTIKIIIFAVTIVLVLILIIVLAVVL